MTRSFVSCFYGLLFLFCLDLLSCRNSQKTKPTDYEKIRHETLVVQIDTEPPHLVIMLQPDIWARQITSHNVFESLVRIDPKTSQYISELAEKWTVTEDGRVYIFHLRPNVKWHDNTQFTGQDVKFTFDRLLDPKVRAAATRASLEPLIESYKLIAPNQFQIICKTPSRFFLQALSALSILPKHIMGKGDLNEHPSLRSPVGTGPYRFVYWQSGREILLERFDNYWGQKPRIKRTIYRLVHDSDLALKLAKRGELDFLPRVRTGQWVSQVLKDATLTKNFKTIYYLIPGSFFILLNHQNEFFKDVRVRRAFAKLLDLDTIVEKILFGFARKIGSMIWFDDPDYDAAIKPIAFDPIGAKNLLLEAGFKDQGEGLKRNGKKFEFVFLLPAGSKSAERWITLYQEELRKAGIEMKIQTVDWAVFLQRIREHKYDAGALGMSTDGPLTDLYLQFHSSQIADGQNYAAYKNIKVDQLTEAIRVENDPVKRKRMSSQLQQILADEVAIIPLFAMKQPGLIAKKVHGVYSSPMWYQLRDWWIE